MNVDPNGPCPMTYEEAREWRALRSGKPPEPEIGIPYEMPTHYEDRMKYLEKYRNAKVD